MIGVGVGIDELIDIDSCRRCIAHGVEHFLGQADGEQGIDQQGLVAIDDEASIAPPPTAIGQQISEQVVADVVQTLFVLPFRHWLSSFSFMLRQAQHD